MNEDVVGAAPTGDDPTTSEQSKILCPIKVSFISEVLKYWEAKSNDQTTNISLVTAAWFHRDGQLCPIEEIPRVFLGNI